MNKWFGLGIRVDPVKTRRWQQCPADAVVWVWQELSALGGQAPVSVLLKHLAKEGWFEPDNLLLDAVSDEESGFSFYERLPLRTARTHGRHHA